jgi:uncharacterized protein (TIGR00255 family)
LPLRSMTGFGTAEGSAAGGRLRVEVRSVNHRHLAVQVKAPGSLGHLEADIRERLRLHLARGSVTVTARWLEAPGQAAGIVVDADRARTVVGLLRGLGRELGIAGDVDLATVARIPDVLRVVEADEAPVEAAAVLEIVDRAAAGCAAMREREGAMLAADLVGRMAALEALADRIASRAPERLAAERDRLGAAVQELACGIAVDPGRLAQEIAFLADRYDVTEELVRFRAHVAAVRAVLDGPGSSAIGRELSFVLQELGREANTIGSKANDVAIAEAVIAIKGELERVREQVENLE